MARYRRRRRVKRQATHDLKTKLKNAVANLGRRCSQDSATVRAYATPILSAVDAGVENITCVYCYTPITLSNVSWDHKLPISRGGLLWVPNLAVCCLNCNKTKGSLTEEEYCDLLEVMIPWPQEAKDNVCRRLRLGGSFFGRFKRRK